MLVAFWSSHHGQCGATSNLISLSLAISLKYNFKVLVSHSQYGETQLERALVPDVDKYIGDTLCNYGLEPVLRLTKNGLLNIDNFSDYTIPILKNNGYDLLAGVRREQEGAIEKAVYENAILKVLEMSKEKYDFVFVDIASGFLNPLSKKIIDISDLVVVNINQNKYVLDKIHKSNYINEIEDKAIFCIGKYEDGLKYNAKNIKRKYKIKELISVPYSAGLIDRMNRGDIIELFGRNIIEKKKKTDSNFFNTIVDSAETIVKKINI